MVRIRRKHLFFSYFQIWFSQKLLESAPFPTKFFQCQECVEKKGWVREAFHTLVSSLVEDGEGLLSKMNSTTRNEIRQVQAKALVAKTASLDEFVVFFNQFAKEKRIRGTTASKMASLGESFFATKIETPNAVLAMHAYIMDQENRKARLLLSASSRFSEGLEKGLIGKANRFLHFWDMLELKGLGFKEYDWGGVSLDQNNRELNGIDKFKEGFGGVPRTEYNYTPKLVKWFLKK